MAKHATVDGYIDALPDGLRETALSARAVLDATFPSGSAAIRWAHPTWSIGKDPVCYLKMATPKHLTLGFWKGASLDDPSGRLETSGHVMAHVKLRTASDVGEVPIAQWARQAITLSSGSAADASTAQR